MKAVAGKTGRIVALLCLMVPMFASYFFDDMFSTLSQIFQHPECLELGWDSADYGFYAGGYSFLCVCGGLIVCGILLEQGYQIPGAKQKIALLYGKEADFPAVLAKAAALRDNYEVTILPQGKKLGKQLGQLEAAGFAGAAFMDKDDVKIFAQQ